MSAAGPNDKSTTESEVHSANSWETADLGDKSRNEKFLRLMGAAKKEHRGRFVIGDSESAHARPRMEGKHMEEELAEQYNQGMEHRLAGGRKGHIGLGFHDDDKEEEVDEKEKGEEEEEKEDDDQEKDDQEKDDQEKDDQEKDEKETDDEEDDGDDDSHNKDDAESERSEKNERKRESLDKAGPDHEEAKKMKFVKGSS